MAWPRAGHGLKDRATVFILANHGGLNRFYANEIATKPDLLGRFGLGAGVAATAKQKQTCEGQ
ncbi:MAG: hypothetical protein WBM46_11015 [Polyangiales bacterium]